MLVYAYSPNHACVSVSYSWSDGTALDYENWENGTPSRQPGRNCISMSLTGKQHQNVLEHPLPNTQFPHSNHMHSV